jgi:hypothetical protein
MYLTGGTDKSQENLLQDGRSLATPEYKAEILITAHLRQLYSDSLRNWITLDLETVS